MDRRILDLNNFDNVINEAERLSEKGYRKAGQWDLAHVCSHCVLGMQAALDGTNFKPPWFLQWILKWLGPLLLNSILKKRAFNPGLKAPPIFLPENNLDEVQELERFKKCVHRFQNHAGEYQRSPVYGYLSPQQWRDLHIIHCSHHLGFLVPND